jgi:integrating conjugative element relaxase (TIGR03760 family)
MGVDLLILFGLLVGIGVAVWWRRGSSAPAAAGVPAAMSSPPAAAAIANPHEFIRGSRPDHFRVLGQQDLLRVTGAERLIDHLARRSRLSRAMFDRDLLPAVRRYAELVQLMPASESHHHANVGGLLAHTLETVQQALLLRDGYLLPRNGGAEVIAAQRDYWTYAVFLGALFHDVGKPLTDLRIDMVQPRGAEPIRWNPLAGSLVDCQAQQYVVRFAPKSERDYQAHSKLGLVMVQRLAPPTALTFLGRCPEVLNELSHFLSGERGSALDEIISKADQHSTKTNLADGTRARFASARSTPLIEQLMGAIRELLDDGSLPLNRDGAAGWVYEGSVWFVAKRLADSVREHIVARAGENAGIPGAAKNDRLFDCWQEYRAIEVNRMTDKAIWQVTVHGEDGEGYEHSLSMLRFPLAKVFIHGPDSYPDVMRGRIEIRSSRGASKTDDGADVTTNPSTPGVADGDMQRTVSTNDDTERNVGIKDLVEYEPVGRAPTLASTTRSKRTDEIPMPMYPPKPTPTTMGSDKPTASRAVSAKAPHLLGRVPLDTASGTTKDDLFLPADQSARAALRPKSKQQQRSPHEMPASAPSVDASALTRSTLMQPDVSEVGSSNGKEPSAWAVKFMQWLQRGLSDGALKYNEAGAPVHFVDAGVALVSPVIFRLFVDEHGEPPFKEGEEPKHNKGFGIQREVFKAGWHLLSPDKNNIWTFAISKKGGQTAAHLAAVVLQDARRWFVEPPPPNPALRPAASKGDDAKKKAA